jgi:putative addiction module component (TIGR02574 family)
MKNKSKEIIEEVLALSENDRFDLIEQLLDSFEKEEDENTIDERWKAEILRRSQELESDSVKPISWSRVKKMAHDRSRQNA